MALVYFDVFILIADNVGNTSNNRPGIHDTLTTRYSSLCLFRTIVKSLDHLFGHDVPLLLIHLQRYGQDHEHVINSIDTHRVYVRKGIGTCNTTLKVRVLHKWVKEVCARYQLNIWAIMHFGHTAVRSFLGNAAVSDVFEILKECGLGYFAPSSF